MARKRRTPGYLLHKATGQARVIIDNREIYLGAYGSEESKAEYDRLIALWQHANSTEIRLSTVTIGAICVAYLKYAMTYYVKDGQLTTETSCLRSAMRPLKNRYGSLRATNFGPMKLKKVRDDMIAAGWVRTSINRQVQRIIRMLKWAKEEELLVPAVYASCAGLKSLALDRTEAAESDPVRAIAMERVTAVREFVSRQVWGMIQLQLETAMRPQEVRMLRMSDLDRSRAESWEYIPARHKTQHHGRDRRIYLNSRAQAIVLPFVKIDPDAYLFSPADAFREFQEARIRKTAVPPSQRDRTVKQPRRTAGVMYTKDSYARAITRACEAAFEMPDGLSKDEKSDWRKEHAWSPNQLRHTAATTLEREFGEDVARAILGHSSKQTSQIYIEEDFEKARKAMEQRA